MDRRISPWKAVTLILVFSRPIDKRPGERAGPLSKGEGPGSQDVVPFHRLRRTVRSRSTRRSRRGGRFDFRS